MSPSSLKEAEILQRQKLLAARLTPNSSKSSATATAKAARKSLIRTTSIHSNGEKNSEKSGTLSSGYEIEASKPSTSNATQSALLKRKPPPRSVQPHPPPSFSTESSYPTVPKKMIEKEATTLDEIDRTVNSSKLSLPLKRPSKGRNVLPQKLKTPKSPPLKRKTLSESSSSTFSTLSKLVPKVMSGGISPSSKEESYFPLIQPDDFWKHLREWDFMTYYNNSLNQNDSDSSNSSPCNLKPLPATFLNHRHYAAAWAPLVLAECRANVLQEWMTSGRQFDSGVLVQIEATHSRIRAVNHRGSHYHSMTATMDEIATGGYVQLTIPRHGTRGPPISFLNGDICLLIQCSYANLIPSLAHGHSIPTLPGKDVGDLSGISLVGHTESFRSNLDGLVLKVSKRKWAKIGQKEMMVIKLGSNITALREFTALARVETLPLQRYLLGLHLVNNSPGNSNNCDKKKKLKQFSHNQSADSLLQRIGGSEALGEGFIKYVSNKFNASQLTAIAASASEYGEGGFTLIKGPPGTGKTTTLVAVLNSLHIRQYNKYYEEVRRIASAPTGTRHAALELARRAIPRLLVVAPSNAAVDNIILKIMEDKFVDGKGQQYKPSMIRVGVGKSVSVQNVSLEAKINEIIAEYMDCGKHDSSIETFKTELSQITQDIARLRRRCHAIASACPYPLGQGWEIRIDEVSFQETSRVYFVDHKNKTTTFECPPPPEPGEAQFATKSMPEYRNFMNQIVKLVERYFHVKGELECCSIVKSSTEAGANQNDIRQSLEDHVLNSVNLVMTTLGSAGSRSLEAVGKFEVVVVDEAAQSVEPSVLSSLHLGSRHAVLVGDPQQLPATIFNVSGRNSKYDRSLFQRLEEAGQPVYMLNEQYRMHPEISYFPRTIFYDSNLLDGLNVRSKEYGNPLRTIICPAIPVLSPFTILDLDSKEERGGTSLSNPAEAHLALFLYMQLQALTRNALREFRVAIITPYAQQSKILRQVFCDALGPGYVDSVEINTVDGFQGREAPLVIFSAVRAAGSQGIGFLSDVRRMNVALTRAKYFLFVIAHCNSIVVNPYWSELVQHARETKAVVSVPVSNQRGQNRFDFGTINEWKLDVKKPHDPRIQQRCSQS